MSERTDRRSFLNQALLGAAGAGAAYSLEEKILLAAIDEKPDERVAKPVAPAAEPLPCGKIGKYQVSRMLMGGNLIGGFAHSRDLIYTSRLLKAYNTEAKIFETLELGERNGINTIQIGASSQDVVEKYKRERGSKLQTMICVKPEENDAKTHEEIKRVVDKGANMVYTHGEVSDRLTMPGRVDILGKALDMMRAEGVPAGIGGHSLETPMACEQNKLNPDYYVKTFHQDRYWSATPPEDREEWCWYKGHKTEHDQFHDNIWCLDAEKTAAFMATVEKPWVAFKVLAAGAIPPRSAFSHAFRNGADFIIVGMFDFQVEEDAALARDALRKLKERKRPWRA